jgi:hypothetical protein
VLLALGVRAFSPRVVDGLIVVSLFDALWPGLLTEYGPAVAGLAGISGRRNFVGLMGATESPPCETVVDNSGRTLTGGASAAEDVLEDVEEFETFRIGENVDMTDPGLAGRFLFAIAAFFCANIVSLKEGFGGPVVLLEKPSPGRAVATGSAFFGEFGLSGDFSKSFC